MKPDSSIVSAVHHIAWTLDHSPKTYVVCREMLMDLRMQLVNMELKMREAENDRLRKA